jgi:ribA/ribD-fused uncharacterized protein
MAIWFYSKTPGYEWLSNFYPAPIELEGLTWPSVEHFYQSQRFPGTDLAETIRAAEKPAKAKSLADGNKVLGRPDWAEVKLDIMRRALEAKFHQHAGLARQLVATGDEELLHQSKSDTFWGRTPDGQGENHLGRLLMELRAQHRLVTDA